jgi:hypothetical protein
MKIEFINFFGIQRSGNHAVLNWLLGLFSDKHVFFNNVQPNKDLRNSSVGVSVPPGVKAYKTRGPKGLIENEEFINYVRVEGGIVLCSYENFNLQNFQLGYSESPQIEIFGSPKKSHNILLLRNPFSMIQSTANVLRKWQGDKPESWFIEQLDIRLKLWNIYASVFLENNSFTKIYFDKWLCEKEYRNEIAAKFDFENSDKNIDFISDAGQGSSFSGRKLDDRKDVLNRWGQSEDHNIIVDRLLRLDRDFFYKLKEISPETKIPTEIL